MKFMVKEKKIFKTLVDSSKNKTTSMTRKH